MTEPSQFAEEGLVPHQVFAKRLKFALDAQAGDDETSASIHRLLRDAKREGIVTLSLIHSMMLGEGASLIMSVTVECHEGGRLRVREHEASPGVVSRIHTRIREEGREWSWDALPCHSLV